MSETLDGAELSRLLLAEGTTATDIAAMDLEALTQKVAYQRKNKLDPGAVDPAMSDEQLARSILAYAQSEPADWPVPSRRIAGRGSWVLLLGIVAGAAAGFVSPLIVPQCLPTRQHGQELYFILCLGSPIGGALGAGVGWFAGMAATTIIARTWLRALVALLAALVASTLLVGLLAWLQMR